MVEKNTNNKLYIDIGKRIAIYRKTQNLSQAQLAQKLKVRQQLIADYEIGRRRMPISFLFKLANILFIKVEDLLGLENKNKPGPMSKIERKIEYIKTLPVAKQKKILELLDSVIEIAS